MLPPRLTPLGIASGVAADPDFSEYETVVGAGGLTVGFGGVSAPLTDYFLPSAHMLLGPLPDVDCDNSPMATGCYDVDVPGLIDSAMDMSSR